MTPQQLLEQAGISLRDYREGRHYDRCPRCSALRKKHHQKLKCLSVMVERETAYWRCHHCGWTGPEKGNGNGRSEWTHYDYSDDLRKVKRPAGGYFWQHKVGREWESGSGEDTKGLLYRIDECRQAIAEGQLTVLVVEGEKDVDTCWRLGFAATCNAHGASEPGKAPKWTEAHSMQLLGCDVVAIGDNDEPGRAHVRAVCETTEGKAYSVRVIDLAAEWDELPEGGDISDWAAWAGPGAEARLADLIAEAKPYTRKVDIGLWDSIAWDGVDVPEQQWTVPDLIPANEVCLFSGYGGGGKSTVGLHLAAAHALGAAWLSGMPEQGPSFFIDVEDHIDVIHRRLAAICRNYGCTYKELIDGGLHVMSLHGKNAVMATVDKAGVVQPTQLYAQVLAEAKRIRPVQIVLAPSSHLYAGSEIDRSQVTQFIGLLSQLASVSNGSVVLISHPSLTGMQNQSGISGSTGWHNAVRSRMYLETLKNGEGADVQPNHDLRVLRFLKNQYGPPSQEITLRYQDGMFLPEKKPASYEIAAREAKVIEVFVAVLARLLEEKRNLSHQASAKNYAPRIIAEEPEAKAIKVKLEELENAMRQLFKSGRIKVQSYGPPSKGWERIEPKTHD